MAENNDATFRLIKSSRGGNKLEENGFLFDKHRILSEITYWQCERRKECKAILHIQGMEIRKRINQHVHGPDMQKIFCLETKAGVKRKAAQSQESTHHIVGESVSNITEGTAAKLLKLNSLKRTIQRERRKVNFVPIQPQSLVELEIPMKYTITAKNGTFLLYDSGPEERRILIFGTHKNIAMLELSQKSIAFMEREGGPTPLEDGHLLTSYFALLPKKSQETYIRMWKQ